MTGVPIIAKTTSKPPEDFLTQLADVFAQAQ
jgi:hypothetical protein